MTKEQALYNFWSSFGVPAYVESTVPDDATFPRITYNVKVDTFDRPVTMTASVWDRSDSWERVTGIVDQIAEELGRGGTKVNGVLWIKPGTPFAQDMTDPDKQIRRKLLNVEAEYA